MGVGTACCCRVILPLLATFLVEHYGGKDADVQMLEARTNPGMTTSVVLPDSTVVFFEFRILFAISFFF